MRTARKILCMMIIVALCITSIPANHVNAETKVATMEQKMKEIQQGYDAKTMVESSIGSDNDNALANYLNDTVQSQEKMNNSYCIRSAKIDDDEVVVEYSSQKDAELFVAIYDEDSKIMVTSAKAQIEYMQNEVSIPISNLPEYFVIRVFMYDKEKLAPLCNQYESNYYTKEMQDLLKTTVDDFDDEYVANLDEDEDNNFIVFSKDVQILDNSVGYNSITKKNETDYTIENFKLVKDKQLAKGDIISYSKGSEVIVIKIKTISFQGTTANIQSENLSKEDQDHVFECIKIIESSSEANDEDVEVECAEGVTPASGTDSLKTQQPKLKNKALLQKKKTSIDTGDIFLGKYNLYIRGGSSSLASNQVCLITGSFSVYLNVHFSLLKSGFKIYIEDNNTIKIPADINIPAKISLSKNLLDDVKYPLPGGFYIGFNLSISVEIENEANSTVHIEEWIMADFVYLDSAPFYSTVGTLKNININSGKSKKAKISIEFGAGLSLGNEVIGTNLAIELRQGFYLEPEWYDGGDEAHSCEHCITCPIYTQTSLYLQLDALYGIINVTGSVPLSEVSLLGGFSYCYDTQEEKWFQGDSELIVCPHKKYTLDIIVHDRDGKAVEGATVINGNDEKITDSNGKARLIVSSGPIDHILVIKDEYESRDLGRIVVSGRATTKNVTLFKENEEETTEEETTEKISPIDEILNQLQCDETETQMEMKHFCEKENFSVYVNDWGQTKDYLCAKGNNGISYKIDEFQPEGMFENENSFMVQLAKPAPYKLNVTKIGTEDRGLEYGLGIYLANDINHTLISYAKVDKNLGSSEGLPEEDTVYHVMPGVLAAEKISDTSYIFVDTSGNVYLKNIKDDNVTNKQRLSGEQQTFEDIRVEKEGVILVAADGKMYRVEGNSYSEIEIYPRTVSNSVHNGTYEYTLHEDGSLEVKKGGEVFYTSENVKDARFGTVIKRSGYNVLSLCILYGDHAENLFLSVVAIPEAQDMKENVKAQPLTGVFSKHTYSSDNNSKNTDYDIFILKDYIFDESFGSATEMDMTKMITPDNVLHIEQVKSDENGHIEFEYYLDRYYPNIVYISGHRESMDNVEMEETKDIIQDGKLQPHEFLLLNDEFPLEEGVDYFVYESPSFRKNGEKTINFVGCGYFSGVKTYTYSEDYIDINGFQINTKDGLFRTIYSTNYAEDEVKEIGLIYGLSSIGATDENMLIGTTSEAVRSYKATEKGIANYKYSPISDSRSFIMSMSFGKNNKKAYTAEYLIRAYVILEDDSIAYTDVKHVSVYDIAEALYNSGKASNEESYNKLYDILKTVNPDYEETPFNKRMTLDQREQGDSNSIQINGFMISTNNILGEIGGVRTVYSTSYSEDEIERIGLIYSVQGDYDEEKMVMDYPGNESYTYTSSQNGKSTKHYGNPDWDSYIMTMNFGGKVMYDKVLYVKAYVQLKDGTIVYSDTENYSVFSIARNLYEECKMGNYNGHQFLYENILTYVDESYQAVPYFWGSSITDSI